MPDKLQVSVESLITTAILGICIVCCSLTACSSVAGYTITKVPPPPRDPVEQFASVGYWKLLETLPGQIQGLGTILTFTPSHNVVINGNIFYCLPTSIRGRVLAQTRPAIPELNKYFHDISPTQFLKLEHLDDATSQFRDLRAITIASGNLVTESLDTVALEMAVSSGAGGGTIPATCLEKLGFRSYVIQDLLYYDNASYRLVGRKGPITLTVENVAAYFGKLPIGFAISNGLLTKQGRTYVGVRDQAPLKYWSSESGNERLFGDLAKYCEEYGNCKNN